ncbi:hypothetical protein Cs7R123_60250 [Catellatospora sp. TT07R-123]|uniref:hypothetical protein n=1 Tax=Catellatospora sp. TT07R-123 TaxID=2733863 RepID=UPI001B0DEF44|nr:hypothetical protein [Catellatospora sp. TT07R-123]GHJ48683.1 hypothetical protein Cs7R123_60250 [Catellatospora sp. TT07R-123]
MQARRSAAAPGRGGANRRHGAPALLTVLAALGVLAGCSAEPEANTAMPGGAQEAQRVQVAYQDQIAADRAKLAPGHIDLDGPDAPEVGTTYQVKATICGPMSTACGPIGAPSPAASASAGASAQASPQASASPLPQVMTGARIRVRLSSQLPGKLDAVSNAVQPVVAADDTANWIWDVRADEPGDYTLTFVVSTLAGDSGENLMPDQVFTLRFPVASTSTYWWSSTGATAWQVLLGIGGLLSAFGVSILGVAKWLRRRYRGRTGQAAAVAGAATALTDPVPPGPGQ